MLRFRSTRLVAGLMDRSVVPILALGLYTALTGSGCDSLNMIERADPDKAASSLERRNFEIDVQPMMRGTVASEAVIAGENPTIVRGYGLVVGLPQHHIPPNPTNKSRITII